VHEVVPRYDDAGDEVAQHPRYKDEGIAHAEGGQQGERGHRGRRGQQLLGFETLQQAG